MVFVSFFVRLLPLMCLYVLFIFMLLVCFLLFCSPFSKDIEVFSVSFCFCNFIAPCNFMLPFLSEVSYFGAQKKIYDSTINPSPFSVAVKRKRWQWVNRLTEDNSATMWAAIIRTHLLNWTNPSVRSVILLLLLFIRICFCFLFIFSAPKVTQSIHIHTQVPHIIKPIFTRIPLLEAERNVGESKRVWGKNRYGAIVYMRQWWRNSSDLENILLTKWKCANWGT